MSKQQHIKAWRANTKQKLIHAMGGKCQICGYDKTSFAFDFHHLDPSAKDSTISMFMVRPRKWEVIKEEASKCVLLCSNCHRELHAGATALPSTFQKFDESLIPRELLKLPIVTYCPICDSEKQNCYKYCSRSCAAKSPLTNPFDWSRFDVVHMVEVEKLSYVSIAKLVGCSDVSVKKRYVKLKNMLSG